MHFKRRLLNFESTSVALFASLAIGGFALQARADDTTKTPSATTSPAAQSGGAKSPFSAGPTTSNMGAGAATSTAAGQQTAFQKADTDGDGKLSRKEAAAVPGLAARFDKLDTNKDGSLSASEFDAGSK